MYLPLFRLLSEIAVDTDTRGTWSSSNSSIRFFPSEAESFCSFWFVRMRREQLMFSAKDKNVTVTANVMWMFYIDIN